MSPSGRGGEPDGDTVPAAAARMAVPSRGPAGQAPRRPGARPGQPAGVSHATVAQVRTDLQGISHAGRNSSDKGWRLAVPAGVPGRPGMWQVSYPPARNPVWTTGQFALGYRHGASPMAEAVLRPAHTCRTPGVRNTFSNTLPGRDRGARRTEVDHVVNRSIPRQELVPQEASMASHGRHFHSDSPRPLQKIDP